MDQHDEENPPETPPTHVGPPRSSPMDLSAISTNSVLVEASGRNKTEKTTSDVSFDEEEAEEFKVPSDKSSNNSTKESEGQDDESNNAASKPKVPNDESNNKKKAGAQDAESNNAASKPKVPNDESNNKKAKAQDATTGAKQNEDSTKEDNQYDNSLDLDMMKAKTMYEMVDIMPDGRRTLFLTGKQSDVIAGKDDSLLKMCQALELMDDPEPKLVISLLPSYGMRDQLNTMTKIKKCETKKEKDKTTYLPPFESPREEQMAEERLDAFMEKILIPLAVRTNAIVIVYPHTCSCCLAKSFHRMVSVVRNQWNRRRPFRVVSITGHLFNMYLNPDSSAEWRSVMEYSKSFKKAHEDYMKKLKGGKFKNREGKIVKPEHDYKHDLHPSSDVNILVSEVREDGTSKFRHGTRLSSQLLCFLASSRPTLGIQSGQIRFVERCMNLINARTPVILLDLYERPNLYKRTDTRRDLIRKAVEYYDERITRMKEIEVKKDSNEKYGYRKIPSNHMLETLDGCFYGWAHSILNGKGDPSKCIREGTYVESKRLPLCEALRLAKLNEASPKDRGLAITAVDVGKTIAFQDGRIILQEDRDVLEEDACVHKTSGDDCVQEGNESYLRNGLRKEKIHPACGQEGYIVKMSEKTKGLVTLENKEDGTIRKINSPKLDNGKKFRPLSTLKEDSKSKSTTKQKKTVQNKKKRSTVGKSVSKYIRKISGRYDDKKRKKDSENIEEDDATKLTAKNIRERFAITPSDVGKHVTIEERKISLMEERMVRWDPKVAITSGGVFRGIVGVNKLIMQGASEKPPPDCVIKRVYEHANGKVILENGLNFPIPDLQTEDEDVIGKQRRKNMRPASYDQIDMFLTKTGGTALKSLKENTRSQEQSDQNMNGCDGGKDDQSKCAKLGWINDEFLEDSRFYVGFTPEDKAVALRMLTSRHVSCINVIHTPFKDADQHVRQLVRLNPLENENPVEGLELLQEAWCEVDICHMLATFNHYVANFIYIIQLAVAWTLVLFNAIQANAGIQGTSGSIDAGMQGTSDIIFGLSIIATLLVSLETLLMAKPRYLELRSAALVLESIIWKYRARVGDFTIDPTGADSSRPERRLCEFLVTWRRQLCNVAELEQTTLKEKHGNGWFRKLLVRMKIVRRIYRHNQYDDKMWNDDDDDDDEMLDDHHSPVGPDAYKTMRIETQLEDYKSRIPSSARARTSIRLILFLCTAGASVISYVELSQWAVVVAALATMVASWDEFTDSAHNCQRQTRAAVELENLLSKWNSLSENEKAMRKQVTNFVMTGEAIIADERLAWLSTADRKDKDEDDSGQNKVSVRSDDDKANTKVTHEGYTKTNEE